MATRKILVAVEHPEGTAAVVRRGRELWLQADARHGAAAGLEDRGSSVIGLAGDRTLQGGRLPDGAASAQVVDDAGVPRQGTVGDGVWAIVLDQPCVGALSPVCFRRADGSLVAPSLPVRWARTPVTDADEPCPACGATGWDEVRPGGARDRYGQPIGHFAACRACGHENALGTWSVYGSVCDERDPEEVERLVAAAEAELRLQARAALGRVAFAVLAARGREGRIGGWGSSDDEMTSVTVEHGPRAPARGPALSVQTEHEPRPYEGDVARARSTLRGELSQDAGEWPRRSDAGRAIWLHAGERERLRVAALATVTQRTLLVDGEPLRFATVTAGDRWVAVARRGEFAITVAACGVDAAGVELVTLAGPLRALVAPD